MDTKKNNKKVCINLIRELSDALYKILVGLPLSSNYLAHDWDNLEGILVVHPV